MLSTLVLVFIPAALPAALLANQPAAHNQPFDIFERFVVELLFLIGFQQFALRFKGIRLGDVHRDPQWNFPNQGSLKQPFFARILQAR